MNDSQPSEEPSEARKPRHFGEDFFILLSIFSIWPAVLDWSHPVFEVVMYAALAGLVWILYRRIKRFNQARQEHSG